MDDDKINSVLAKKAYWKWKQAWWERGIKLENDIFIDERESMESTVNAKPDQQQERKDSNVESGQKKIWKIKSILNWKLPASIDPQTNSLYFFWQFLSSLFLVYNALFIPLRSSFPYQSTTNQHIWLAVDYTADAVYLIDCLVFQRRRQYLKRGCVVDDPRETAKNYFKSARFKRDFISLLPFDLLYFLVGFKPIVRVNRLVKVDSYQEFNNLFEMMLKRAFVFRVIRTTVYLLYAIHLDACLYYYYSHSKNFNSPWGYDLQGIAYIRCFFWSFMNITNIGNVPDPSTTAEYILQFLHYFLGLFIFSVVIGQVRDSVQAASAEEETYRVKKNACINYLQKNKIPLEVQKKVRFWFEYTWNTQRILDEHALLMKMPGKMHTEIAINVHMDVLSKVEIFKECNRQLLYDLLVKLRPVLYLPGDYVCRKGEVGREMYIITNGMVQVVGEKRTHVFASLHPGTAFGEISLLAIGGGNRRTANIFSPGYTTLFILYKNDLNEVLLNYPDAQQVLRKKAQKMLNKDKQKKQPVTSINVSKLQHKTRLGMGVVNALWRGKKT